MKRFWIHHTLIAAGLLAGGTILHAAEVPYGHADFAPTAERPMGWRGDGSGHFPGATPPDSFDEKTGKNVLWSLKLKDWSASSPIVVGKVVITAAQPDTLMGVDADTGKILWQDTLGLLTKWDGKTCPWADSGYSWPVSDGERVYKYWDKIHADSKNPDKPILVCYDVKTGERLWLRHFKGGSQFQPASVEQPYGYGPDGKESPVLCDDVIIYDTGEKGGYTLVALDKMTGDLRWRSDKNCEGHCSMDNTPVVMRVGGRKVLVTNIGMVLDPATGKTLGEAFEKVEKDGETFSRLWGWIPGKGGQKGEFTDGLAPCISPDQEGVIVFGEDWPCSGPDVAWDEAKKTQVRGNQPCYLAVKIGFDAQGKLTSTDLWQGRKFVPRLEYGNVHLTLLKDSLLVMPGYAAQLTVMAMKDGQVIVPPKALWRYPKPDVVADPANPEIKAAMDECGMTDINAVNNKDRGGGRQRWSSYSRAFVDSQGKVWYMNRQAQMYRIDPANNFESTKVGELIHPIIWNTCSNPVPHGKRIYIRTFGSLVCVGEK